jgi:hypothetical protein
MLFDSEMGQVLSNFIDPHLAGWAHLVKVQKVLDVVKIRLFGSGAKVFETKSLVDTLKQLWRIRHDMEEARRNTG